jgi:hypothetical protein
VALQLDRRAISVLKGKQPAPRCRLTQSQPISSSRTEPPVDFDNPVPGPSGTKRRREPTFSFSDSD